MMGDAGKANPPNRRNNHNNRPTNNRRSNNDRKIYDCPHCKNVVGHPKPGRHPFPPKDCYFNKHGFCD